MAIKIIIQICKRCKKEFSYQTNQKGYPKNRCLCNYCQTIKAYSNCPECGILMRSNAKKCVACFGKSIRGKNAPNYKGYHITKEGYKVLYVPHEERYKYSHKKDNRRILEHHFIWEQYHNKSLPKGYVIHHLNGIRLDNRIENLIAIPIYKHNSLSKKTGKDLFIKALKERIKYLESQLQISINFNP